MVPVSELAEMLAERSISDGATDREWNRAVREKAGDIEKAVDEGALAAHRRGRRLLVNAASFYDWLGEPVPVLPEWGLECSVHKDEGTVETLRPRFQSLRDAVKDTPGGDGFDEDEPKRMARFARDASAALGGAIRHGYVEKQRELVAVETIVAEVAEEFGEDPLLPELEGLRSGIREEIDPGDPDDEMIERVRKLVHWEIEEQSLTFHA